MNETTKKEAPKSAGDHERGSYRFVELEFGPVSEDQTIRTSEHLCSVLKSRRSVRYFSERAVPREVIENLITIAGSAPSGANKQPWTFCAVSDPALKAQIREAAEKEEFESYNGRMSEGWLQDLAPLGTDWRKPFLEDAPWLIVVFRKSWLQNPDGTKGRTYYSQESVGIACGFLISAIHQCGLATLTHTPSPMAFLSDLLSRPENEKPFLLLPCGYPAEPCMVPDIKREPLEKISRWFTGQVPHDLAQ